MFERVYVDHALGTDYGVYLGDDGRGNAKIELDSGEVLWCSPEMWGEVDDDDQLG